VVAASKNAEKKRGRPFEPCHAGGPGRPAGSRNKATLMLDVMANEAASEVLEKLVGAAKAGDLRAAELLLSRVWPVRKSRPVVFSLPPINRPADLVMALGAIAEAMSTGALTPDEASAAANVLETNRRAIETTELEGRIAALEANRALIDFVGISRGAFSGVFCPPHPEAECVEMQAV
jgi:hypothetical protein